MPILLASDERARTAEPRDRHRPRPPAARRPARLRQRYPPARSGTSLLIGCGCWLYCEDFTSRFIITGTSVSDGTVMAGIDWEATIIALDTGQLPCGGGECRVLRLAASIAGGIPVSLYNTFPASITAPAQS